MIRASLSTLLLLTLCSVMKAVPPPLKNCGASCYSNSIIQALYATDLTPRLFALFDRTRKNPYYSAHQTAQSAVAQAYFELIEQFPACNQDIITKFLTRFVDTVAPWMEMIAPRHPHVATGHKTSPKTPSGVPDEPIPQTVLEQNLADNIKTLEPYLSSKEIAELKSLSFAQRSEKVLTFIRNLPKSFEQHDAAEFLTQIIDALKTNNHRHLINTLFLLTVQKAISCQDQLRSTPFDEQYILTVPVRANSSLQESINTLFHPQLIEYDREECLQSSWISGAPHLLLISLNRFDGHGTTRIKKRDRMVINDTVELPGRDNERFSYALLSVIKHIGSSPVFGHYVCYVQHNGRWYLCNDTAIQTTTLETVLRDTQEDGYIFFYRQTDLPPLELVECAAPEGTAQSPVDARLPQDPFVQDLQKLQERLDRLLAQIVA